MENSVCFRDFEERDIDFIYKCKNNEKLWRHTVGEHHNFSYGEAVEWVHGCMQDDPTYKFWAICKNDESLDIVGWCSIAKIDYKSKSAEAHGIVIGNKEYNDGFTWIESMLFISQYVFETLKFDKITTCWLSIHPISGLLSCFANSGGELKKVMIEDNRCNTLEIISFTKEAYFDNIKSGNFDVYKIMHKIREYSKSLQHNQ